MKDIAEMTMEAVVDLLKTQHDYYKHLTTLNTGSILIIIAFIEKVFRHPVQYSIYAVPLSIAGFLISLLCSLSMMKKVHSLQQDILSMYLEVIRFNTEGIESLQGLKEKTSEAQKRIAEEADEHGKEANRMEKWSNRSFVFGIAVLFIFASINLIFN